MRLYRFIRDYLDLMWFCNFAVPEVKELARAVAIRSRWRARPLMANRWEKCFQYFMELDELWMHYNVRLGDGMTSRVVRYRFGLGIVPMGEK